MIYSDARQSQAWALLTAQAQQYEVASRTFDSLTPAQVAAMLSGLDERPLEAGLLCEAGYWSSLPRVASFLYYDSLELADELLWDLPRGPGQLKKLVYLAIIEATGPSVVCTLCGGTGHPAHVTGKRESCRFCEGRGRLPVLEQSRCSIIGVEESNWRKRWRDRYVRVDQILQSWLQDAREHLAMALAGKPRRHPAHAPARHKVLA